MEAVAVDHEDQQALNNFSVCLQHERWSRQQLEEYQARALQDCRAYAYAHSPFYQRFHQGLMDRPLQELPVLTKPMLMEHFDELVTDQAIHLQEIRQYQARAEAGKLFLDRYQVASTSGSTGEPGIFLLDKVEGTIKANSFARSASWGGITPASRGAAVTSQAPLVVGGQRIGQLHLFAADPLETIVERLNEYQPETLVGYASMASLLAEEQRQGRLHIAPRSIFCASDTLTDAMRQRIEEAWPLKPFNTYGMTEGGILAAECSEHQGMHLFEDFLILEVVDQHNRPVPVGEAGEKVLLTVLFRRTQPLIRYEVSDLVQMSRLERCACGRPFALIESIQGRTIDILYLPSASGGEERIFPYLFSSLFNPLPVSGWQIVLERDGLHIFLTGASETLLDEYLIDALQQLLSKRGALVPEIHIHRVAALRRNASGKTPAVLSHVPHPDR
jgi:putative adenylate-forming enzyme